MAHEELTTRESQLPPREYWLFDERSEKLSVPLDNRGMVDAIEAARFLRSIIAPEYRWRFFKDRHHLYYEAEDYHDPVERAFRTLDINMVRLPRDAHELWHRVFLPPEKPDPEMMSLMQLSFDITLGTYKDAREIIRLERHRQRIINGELRPKRGEWRKVDSRQQGIDFHRQRLERRLAAYETLPPECILAEIRTGASPRNIATELGRESIVRTPLRDLSLALSN